MVIVAAKRRKVPCKSASYWDKDDLVSFGVIMESFDPAKFTEELGLTDWQISGLFILPSYKAIS